MRSILNHSSQSHFATGMSTVDVLCSCSVDQRFVYGSQLYILVNATFSKKFSKPFGMLKSDDLGLLDLSIVAGAQVTEQLSPSSSVFCCNLHFFL